MRVAILCSLLLMSLSALAKDYNTCENDTGTHTYADMKNHRLTFSPEPSQQRILIGAKSYLFTYECTDPKNPKTDVPTIVFQVRELGIIDGTFIPITVTSPLLVLKGALNASLQQVF